MQYHLLVPGEWWMDTHSLYSSVLVGLVQKDLNEFLKIDASQWEFPFHCRLAPYLVPHPRTVGRIAHPNVAHQLHPLPHRNHSVPEAARTAASHLAALNAAVLLLLLLHHHHHLLHRKGLLTLIPNTPRFIPLPQLLEWTLWKILLPILHSLRSSWSFLQNPRRRRHSLSTRASSRTPTRALGSPSVTVCPPHAPLRARSCVPQHAVGAAVQPLTLKEPCTLGLEDTTDNAFDIFL